MNPASRLWLDRLRRLLGSKLLRAVISALLLSLLIFKLNISDLANTLSEVVPALLLTGIALFVAASLLNVFKWQLILRTQGVRVPFFNLVSWFYIGFFFSNFLPTNFGGDVIKIYKLSRFSGRPVEAASSVFVDRVSATFALLAIALVPAVVELRLLGTKMTVAIVALFLLSLLLIGLLGHAGFARRLSNLPLLRSDPFGLRRHARSFYFSLHEFRHHRGALAAILIISLMGQAVQNFAVYFLALSLGINLSVLYYFIFIPVVQIVSMIPVSLNGLGVREGAWVLLFGQAGVASAEAFSMSILNLLVMTATSLFGGIFYLFDRSIPAPRAEVDHGQP